MLDFLTKTKEVAGTPSIQPAPSELPFILTSLKRNAVFTALETPYSSQLMASMPVGFNTPNPVDFSGVPSSPDLSVIGIPSIKWSNAPTNKGGC